MNVNDLWILLERFNGEKFYTKTGLDFTYDLYDDYAIIHRSGKEYKAVKSDFEFGLNNPNENRNVYRDNMHRVSSYVLGILNDKRMR